MSTIQDKPDVRPAPHTRVGRFSYNTAEGIWDWDDQMFRILGLRPWSVTPTSEYLLSCENPVLRARVSDGLHRVETDGESFHVTYPLRAADGVDRWVLLVGDPASPTSARPVPEIVGHYVDLTEDLRREGAEAARQAVIESAQHRAVIEQAVGALMVAYGIDADQAFEMLRWCSQDRNIKVRDLAARLMEAMSRGTATEPAIRTRFDDLLHDASNQ